MVSSSLRFKIIFVVVVVVLKEGRIMNNNFGFVNNYILKQ